MTDSNEMLQNKSITENRTQIDKRFLISAFFFITIWLLCSFSIGARLWDDDIPLVYGIMFALFFIGSLISGILLGFSIGDLKHHRTFVIAIVVFIFAALSLIVGIGRIIGPYYIWEHLLPWLGVIGSSAHVVFGFIYRKN